MIIESLFPTSVGISALGTELTKKELDFLLGLPTRKNVGNLTSEDNYVLENPEMLELKKKLLANAQEYFDTVYKPKNKVELYITQSWLNITEPGATHHQHKHPNSFISGVFYVHGEGESDKITFYMVEDQIQVTPTHWDKLNATTWWLPANTGEILMFPSTLIHSVNATSSDKPRISLAFNTFLKGSLGDNLSLTELTL